MVEQGALLERAQGLLAPFHEAVADPAEAQAAVLRGLLATYARTQYGRDHGAEQITTMREFREAFPVVTYVELRPIIKKVMGGEHGVLLDEDPIGWAITRGTTADEQKFIPMTPHDLRLRVSAARAMMQYIVTARAFDLLTGVNLNLNFPSVVGAVQAGDREVSYGYSSGIYVKHVSASTPIRSLPTQDAIDALGGGKTLKDWEARFALAYDQCKDEDVTLLGGVAPTALAFGRYLKRSHRVYPKDLWHVRVLTLGSVPGINTRLAPALRAMYGRKVVIREIYGATEGMFGQQMDEQRGWIPNYDLFLFEVRTRRGVKLLHEMRPMEMGSLIVSTPILSRYEIGDLILALRPPYFRCIGRTRWWTPLEYLWGELSSLNFGRL